MESQYLLEKELLDYKHAGYGILSDSALLRYQEAKTSITDLERNFQRNMAKEARGVWFILMELDGVLEKDLAKWKNNSEGERSKKFVPFANGGTLAILTHTYSPETYKAMFIADNQKLKENKPLFKEIIKHRAT